VRVCVNSRLLYADCNNINAKFHYVKIVNAKLFQLLATKSPRCSIAPTVKNGANLNAFWQGTSVTTRF